MVLSSSNTPRLFIITDRKDEKELQLSPNDQDWEGKLGITMDIYPLYNECAADCALTAGCSANLSLLSAANIKCRRKYDKAAITIRSAAVQSITSDQSKRYQV